MNISVSPGPSTMGLGPGPSGINTVASVNSYSTSNNVMAPLGSLGTGALPSASDTLLLSLRSRPHSRVFRALFQYLPLRDSPNENPQLELALQPGDILLVKGEMDSDGFYRAETLDGRSGLVPSNYVERIPDHLLLTNARAPSPSFPVHVPLHHSTIVHDFTEPDNSQLPESVCPYPPADVSKVTVQEIKQNDTPRVPCPRDLVVEKRLSRSIVVSWSPPEESFIAVTQYHVCVDGNVRAIVPGSYKCRALVEDVTLETSINLSVRALTDQGHSPDAACTIAVGQEAQVAPQHLRVWAITPVAACLRWYPSNSNAEHVISLNSVKVGVCPPSVFQVQLQGLQPSTIYRASVRTKHPKAVLEQRPVERCFDFKTLPKIGLPDPPQNVQAEVGPQPGTLLVSWSPVSNQPKPPSRAAVHSYLVYADGKNIAQVPNATADHVLLRLADLSDDPPIFITVRTRTREGAVSSDSNVARVPRSPYSITQQDNTNAAAKALASAQVLQSAPLLDMATSYPSFAPPPGAFSAGTLPAGYGTGSAAPYTAPAALLTSSLQNHSSLPFQTNPFTAYASPPIQSYAGGYMVDRLAGVAASQQPQPQGLLMQPAMQPPSIQAALGPTTLATGTLTNSHQGTLQATIPKWKSQPMNQYYTFHPRLLRERGNVEEARPTIAEMENNYLLRHRQSEWAAAAAGGSSTMDARARIEAYARQGMRTGSAEERPHGPRHRLVPPRLARVKSESGFGTRSEPDLRPPTLDDDCRWFVALFDYSHHMSPNANAEAEELSFRKHQLIKVYGEVDPDGFYHGQIGSRVGLVPSNMVIEIAKDDLLPRRTARNESFAAPASAEQPALRRMRWGSLKSRSYDYAGDRRQQQPHHDRDRAPSSSYHHMSLDRKELDRREVDRRGDERRDVSLPGRGDRFRRMNGGTRDYDLPPRRTGGDYEDVRYGRDPRDMRDARRDEYRERDYRDYRDREEDDYRDGAGGYRETGRDREPPRGAGGYDRDYDRRDHNRDDERRQRHESGYRDTRGGGERDDYRKDRRPDDGYREQQDQGAGGRGGYDYQRYDQPPQPGTSGMGLPPSQAASQLPPPMGSLPQMGAMTQAMGQMQLQNAMPSMGGGMNAMMANTGMPGPSQPNVIPPMMEEMRLNGGMPSRKMVAKFDYDSRKLSPNVDAEQVELSFRLGDIITIYGDMDEDGFYMGELNGMRGLVPSNFLQTPPLTSLGPSQPTEPMRKGVAFSDGQPPLAVKKVMPARQLSQSSATPTTAPTAQSKPAAKKSVAGQPGAKPLAKKTSDVGKNSAPNVRKTSTAVKKADGPKKK